MPGSLLEGYMTGKRYLQEREEREEQQKREKLEDQLRELRFKGLTRTLERSAEEWEREKGEYQQKEQAMLRLPEEERPYARLGLRLPEQEKPRYPWMGTPYEERGAEKEFHISKPTIRSLTDAERAERYSKIPEGQRTDFQRDFLKKYFEGRRGGDELWNWLNGEEGGGSTSTTEQEDEFIEEARGRKIDWKGVAKDHPDWNIFYIKQKLGVNE